MDKPGVKHILDIYRRHPNAKILLPFPDSPSWDNLPKSGGLDMYDWIEEGKLDKVLLLSQVMDITPELIAQLERQLQGVQPDEAATEIKAPTSSKISKADKLATKIAEDYQDKLAYNDEIKCWMHYGLENKGVWQAITNEFAEAVRIQV